MQVWFPELRWWLQSRNLCVNFISPKQKCEKVRYDEDDSVSDDNESDEEEDGDEHDSDVLNG